jgi:hypothetical protein
MGGEKETHRNQGCSRELEKSLIISGEINFRTCSKYYKNARSWILLSYMLPWPGDKIFKWLAFLLFLIKDAGA